MMPTDDLPTSGKGKTDPRLVELAERLRPMYERAGIPLPDETALTTPVLFVGAEGSRPPVQRVARLVSDLLSGMNLLFMRGREIGEIDAITGDWQAMTPHTFVTWIWERAGILPVKGWKVDDESGKRKPIEGEVGVDQARLILASANLRAKLPEVVAINHTKLPVFREDLDERGSEFRRGFRRIELLQPGYDAETKTYTTLSAENFAEDMDPAAAVEWLKKLTRDFPWGDDERSRSVFVSAFLTMFCRNLYIGRAPLFLFRANLPGSGKSILTRLCIEPVMGAENTAPSGWNRDDRQETRKEMDAAAQEFSPVLWFDDVNNCKVMGTDLNRWLTSSTWTCRIMGTKERFKGALLAVTFLTGNGVTTDDNLDRRTLTVDLFARQRANERKIEADRIELNEAFFADPENLRQCLAVCWALVRWWDNDCDRIRTEQRAIEGFENWSALVPSIAEVTGFKKALAPYEAPDGGNAEGREWKALACRLIAEFCTKREATAAEVTMRDVIRTARLNGLFQDKLFSLEQVQKELEEKVRTKKWAWKRPDKKAEAPEKKEAGEVDEFGLPANDDDHGINEEEKRRQAAEWTDRAMDSSWAKAWRRAAVDGQWFPDEAGNLYAFGDRATSKGSKFLIRRVDK
jgi:hypothetical protein